MALGLRGSLAPLTSDQGYLLPTTSSPSSRQSPAFHICFDCRDLQSSHIGEKSERVRVISAITTELFAAHLRIGTCEQSTRISFSTRLSHHLSTQNETVWDLREKLGKSPGITRTTVNPIPCLRETEGGGVLAPHVSLADLLLEEAILRAVRRWCDERHL